MHKLLLRVVMDWVITYYYHYYLSYAFVQVIDMSCLLARDVYAMFGRKFICYYSYISIVWLCFL